MKLKMICEHSDSTDVRLDVFSNGDLGFDIERIKSFDSPITISKAYDGELDYPFAIDVEDTSYWYAEKADRDNDLILLKKILAY